jgi:uncharacterized membrane protein YciS (DUF1049 family)
MTGQPFARRLMTVLAVLVAVAFVLGSILETLFLAR